MFSSNSPHTINDSGIQHQNNNNDQMETETMPIAAGPGVRIFRRFGAMLGSATGGGDRRNSQHDPETAESYGYVEFGISSDTDRLSGRTLGTFAGVFSPVALSMFSALLFIRVGFLVGNAGLYIVLLQFLIAYLILLFTVASVCAISTNGAVEGGGVYFMISRTLGPEFGGSIGTLFFLANVVGSALAISGCAEGIVENLGPSGYYGGVDGIISDGPWWRFLYCTLVNTLMLIVCLVGAGLFANTSVIILAIVIVCLFSTYISFLSQGDMEIAIPEENQLVQNDTHLVTGTYTGLSLKTLNENLFENYGKDYSSGGSEVNFAIVFGVLFSGVTGIMAGANMSGELKNPSKSIPIGTLSAVAFTFVCYILLSVFIGATTTSFLLQNNFLFLMPINVWPMFVAVGILTATFSTALSNLIGSSRVLEALAKDHVYGALLNFVSAGTYKGNPIVAVFVSWLLVECILLIGSLNIIAQINSVLFMLSYMATNVACLGIELTGAPNFRPSFKYFTWHTCFFGLMGTLIMMFVINAIYASLSIIMCLVLVIGLHIFSPTSASHRGTQWGSISQALMFHQVRKYLLMLDSRKDHVKFWRPQMLLLVSSPRSCCPLIDFVNDLKKGGLYVLGHVKVGDFCATNDDPTIGEYKQWLSLIDHMKVKAFAEITMANTIREGVQHLIRLSGMGAMKPNTIIFGFYDEDVLRDFFESENSNYQTNEFNIENGIRMFSVRHMNDEKLMSAREYVSIIYDVLRMKKNVCLCRHFTRMDKQLIVHSNHIKYIDVWPINVFDPKNENPFDVVSLFMLQLACIINMLPVWKKLHLRVFLCEQSSTLADEPVRSSSTFNINDDNTNGNFNGAAAAAASSTNYHQYEKPAEYKLKQLLNLLRISATIHQIPEWSANEDFLRHRVILKQFTKNSHDDDILLNNISDENVNRSKLYMQRVNQIIREKSDATAVTFIYLPAPPNIDSPTWEQTSAGYLELLTELTAELPPTILVHGVSAVTSTTL